MNAQDTGTGWRPLSKPTRTGPPRTLNQRLNTDGSPILTPFVRLARTHAFHAAGDATVAIALAGSLFFSIDPSAARSRVLLYLICTLAPFALVGPLIGPALDRMKGGHRFMIILTLGMRAGLMLLMIPNIDSLWLFPIAFAQLVLGKTYSVAKAATVPTTVNDHDELVDKNARLAVLSAVAGFIGAVPAVIMQRLFGSSVTLSYALLIYCIGILASFKLPRVMVDDPEVPDDVLEIRSTGIRLAASAMSVLRGVVGFMFFMLAFAFRGGADDLDLSGVGTAAGAAVKHALGFDLDSAGSEPAWKLGLPLAFWGLGILIGNLVAPKLRERFTEENIILGGIGVIFGAAVAAMWAGGLNGAVLLALAIGAAPSGAKLAFDSLVQRDAPGANHGAAFGRFETKFQIAWVIGALIPVILKIPLRLGFFLVAIAALFAGVTYFLGARTSRDNGGSSEPKRLVWPRPGRSKSREAAPNDPGAPQPVAADPYGEAFAEQRIEAPHWAGSSLDGEPLEDPMSPPPWLTGRGSNDHDPTPPMGSGHDRRD